MPSEIPIGNKEETKKLLNEVTSVLSEEPAFIELGTPVEPVVFVGDTHGDVEATREILRRYLGNSQIVFLGDYVDRAPEKFGSIENILFLFKTKTETPEDIILLRGNHEFYSVFERYGFLGEMLQAGFDDSLIKGFESAFSQMPYIATTKNGILGLHAGPPNIKDVEEAKNIPKGLRDFEENVLVSQTVWNDSYDGNIPAPGFVVNSKRGFTDEHSLIYGSSYFAEKMKVFGKNVLLRGHDYSAKGFAFGDRQLTIFTSQRYSDKGKLRGRYVAIMDPEREIKTCRDLKIEQI